MDGVSAMALVGGGAHLNAPEASSGVEDVGVAETHLVALAERGENFDGFGVSRLLFKVSEVVEGVDQCGVESVVLLRRGAPEKEGIEVERDVFI